MVCGVSWAEFDGRDVVEPEQLFRTEKPGVGVLSRCQNKPSILRRISDRLAAGNKGGGRGEKMKPPAGAQQCWAASLEEEEMWGGGMLEKLK